MPTVTKQRELNTRFSVQSRTGMHVYVDLYVTDLPMSSQIGVDPEEGREKEREGGGEREK